MLNSQGRTGRDGRTANIGKRWSGSTDRATAGGRDCVRHRAGGGDYFKLDERGLLFLYFDSDGFPLRRGAYRGRIPPTTLEADSIAQGANGPQELRDLRLGQI